VTMLLTRLFLVVYARIQPSFKPVVTVLNVLVPCFAIAHLACATVGDKPM
jgi:hypothetical protein